MSKTDKQATEAAVPAGDVMAANGPPRGYWEDAKGNLVPVAKIKDIDRLRNKVVVDLVRRAQDMNAALRHFKLETMTEIAGFVQQSAAEYGKEMGGEKGNVTLVSYDGRYKIVRQVAESIAFDERLQVAKAIVDECVHLWAKGANKNIQALVQHAFQVDKAGKVSTGRVLSLRQLNIDDPKWAEAMAAIADSMKTVSSKSYVRFYERLPSGDYVAIPLDAATV